MQIMVRNTKLDVLRGFAVILVLFRHLTLETNDYSVINLVFLGLRRIGWIGVDIFFVLSGYLVTQLLWREQVLSGKANVMRFIKRRSLKIFPLFYVLLLGSAIFFTQHNIFDQKKFLVEFLFLQSYFTGVWEHTWSLSVEEHFYLLIALIFAIASMTGTSNPQRLLVPLTIIVVLSFGLRSYVSLTNVEYNFHTHISASLLRFDGLGLGAITAITTWQAKKVSHHTTSLLKWLIAIITVAVTPYLLFHSQETSIVVRTVGFLLIALLTSLVIVTIKIGHLNGTRYEIQQQSSPSLSRVVAKIGTDSYATYLLHVPLFELITSLNLNRFIPNLFVGVLSIAIAVLAGRFITQIFDQPLLRFRDRICP
jgi:peptidoglycan/LPS O-acetylase OafA/YrhL